MTITRELVEKALDGVLEPTTGKPITELGSITEIAVTGDDVQLSFRLPVHGATSQEKLRAPIVEAITAAGAKQVKIQWSTHVTGRDIGKDDPVPSVANVIVVMSGKGGVGKSTVSANMALALAKAGARVGLLDADMYGPSVPVMLGTHARPTSLDGNSLEPVERFGLKMMSIGFLLDDPREAVVWRGPMLHGALMQFLQDVHWGDLDYLFLDLPPGTGDIPLTLSQKLQVTGAVIVTTPQDVALFDVYKSVSMCQKVNIPILGIVENESYFICDGCEKRHEIFGKGGGTKVAEMANAPLLAQIPMDTACRKAGDAGTPAVMASPESPSALALRDAAEALAFRVAAFHAERSSTVISIDRSGGKNKHLPVVS
ncbi:MAG TPA: Mrp/NBP35 family ATP-binding protein [Polyangiaceae bacterium]|nr:Mrp/NBP35 family ATP-binding protein [Polyangiaceae bacterium]